MRITHNVGAARGSDVREMSFDLSRPSMSTNGGTLSPTMSGMGTSTASTTMDGMTPTGGGMDDMGAGMPMFFTLSYRTVILFRTWSTGEPWGTVEGCGLHRG